MVITYKIVNEFDAPRHEGHIVVLRQVGDSEWKTISGFTRRSTSFRSEGEANDAIESNIRSDKAAATRLGIPVEFVKRQGDSG